MVEVWRDIRRNILMSKKSPFFLLTVSGNPVAFLRTYSLCPRTAPSEGGSSKCKLQIRCPGNCLRNRSPILLFRTPRYPRDHLHIFKGSPSLQSLSQLCTLWEILQSGHSRNASLPGAVSLVYSTGKVCF